MHRPSWSGERGGRTSSRTADRAAVDAGQRRRGCEWRGGAMDWAEPREPLASRVVRTAPRPAKPLGAKRDLPAYGKTVWSWPSSLRSSLADAALASTGAVSATSVRRGRPEGIRLPGEHGISRPTTAQGRPCVRLHLYAAVWSLCATFSRSRPRVPAGTRPSLRPLF